MAKRKSTDEQIIAALLQHGTISAAAQVCGISPRTVYKRMSEQEFQAAYKEAKTDLLREAAFSIAEKLSGAVETVWQIQNDKSVPPAVRVQAAQVIINNAGKFADRLADDETANQEAHNPRDPWDF